MNAPPASSLTPGCDASQTKPQKRDIQEILKSYDSMDLSRCPTFASFIVNGKDYALRKREIEHRIQRHDFRPLPDGLGELTLRCPSMIHAGVASILAVEMSSQLGKLACFYNGDREARRLEPFSLAPVNLAEVDGANAITHQPDAQCRQPQEQYPPIAIEVTCGKEGKHLAALAWDYIVHSAGKIQHVIGIHVNKRRRTCSVSVWTPRWSTEHGKACLDVHCAINNALFRSPVGLPLNSDRQLSLEVDKFIVSERGCYHYHNKNIICISFIRLWHIATFVDTYQHEVTTRMALQNTRPFVIKRSRPQRSPEPDSAHEKKVTASSELNYNYDLDSDFIILPTTKSELIESEEDEPRTKVGLDM